MKVSSKLGPGPGIEFDSLILVPGLQRPGFTGARLVLFIELSFDFWSFIQHLLTVLNSCTVSLRTRETKDSKTRGPYAFLGCRQWIKLAGQSKLSLTTFDGFFFFFKLHEHFQ